ncbi:MAG: phosphate/phosphite/phosphonate ABC transporter substrate-binding protein [Kiloniellaceae bacterium]|nr:phosphate/phosphite/phosphonate ABC transporter substrate-binding protein [Kiloniellaceae bacterium]
MMPSKITLKNALGAAGLAAALALTATTAGAADSIRLAVTDVEGLEALQREFKPFADVLKEASGLEVELFPVTSRNAAAEALRARKVDFVLTGPAEYVVMQKLTSAYPVVGFSRPDYFSAIVVMADSGINAPADLKGKTVTFDDIGSTSGHLGPMQLLADYGLDPRNDVKPMHVHRNVAHEALKRGDVAAIGVNYRSWTDRVRAKDPDLKPGAFKVIARGPDLPNDILVAGPHVDKDVVARLRDVFSEQSDQLIAAILTGEDNQKYAGMQFLPGVQDKDYQYIRNAYATIGYPQYADFVGN